MSEKNFKTEIIYPIRLNRYLYLNNYCSRRQADEMIKQGSIRVNGQRAVLGQKIGLEDKVEVSNAVKNLKQNYQYFIFYKPIGVVSHDSQYGEKNVEDFFPKNQRLSFVGRLDKKSEGLMFITNDGRLVDKMLNPKYEHQKEYSVRVDKELKPSFKRKIEQGVKIEKYTTKPAKITITGPKSFRIILTEGKKHQIRRMCSALNYQVQNLKRIGILNLKLSGLQPGQSRLLKQEEKIELLKQIGII